MNKSGFSSSASEKHSEAVCPSPSLRQKPHMESTDAGQSPSPTVALPAGQRSVSENPDSLSTVSVPKSDSPVCSATPQSGSLPRRSLPAGGISDAEQQVSSAEGTAPASSSPILRSIPQVGPPPEIIIPGGLLSQTWVRALARRLEQNSEPELLEPRRERRRDKTRIRSYPQLSPYPSRSSGGEEQGCIQMAGVMRVPIVGKATQALPRGVGTSPASSASSGSEKSQARVQNHRNRTAGSSKSYRPRIVEIKGELWSQDEEVAPPPSPSSAHSPRIQQQAGGIVSSDSLGSDSVEADSLTPLEPSLGMAGTPPITGHSTGKPPKDWDSMRSPQGALETARESGRIVSSDSLGSNSLEADSLSPWELLVAMTGTQPTTASSTGKPPKGGDASKSPLGALEAAGDPFSSEPGTRRASSEDEERCRIQRVSSSDLRRAPHYLMQPEASGALNNESRTERGSESGIKLKSPSRTGPSTKPQTERRTKPRTGPSTEPRPGPMTGPSTEPRSGARTGPSNDLQTGLRTGPSTEPRPGPRTGPSTEGRTDARTEPRTGSGTEARTGQRTGPSTKPRTEGRTAPRNEPRNQRIGAGIERRTERGIGPGAGTRTGSSTAPSRTVPPSSVPSSTVLPSTVPPSSVPPSTVKSSTVPSRTAQSGTVPSGTVSPSTVPSITGPSSTVPSTPQNSGKELGPRILRESGRGLGRAPPEVDPAGDLHPVTVPGTFLRPAEGSEPKNPLGSQGHTGAGEGTVCSVAKTASAPSGREWVSSTGVPPVSTRPLDTTQVPQEPSTETPQSWRSHPSEASQEGSSNACREASPGTREDEGTRGVSTRPARILPWAKTAPFPASATFSGDIIKVGVDFSLQEASGVPLGFSADALPGDLPPRSLPSSGPGTAGRSCPPSDRSPSQKSLALSGSETRHSPASLESRVLECLDVLMGPGEAHAEERKVYRPGHADDVIPPFYTPRPHPDSLEARMQRCAKYKFLQKQKELLLSSAELHQVWTCLRRFCVRDGEGGESDAIDYSGFLAAGEACRASLGHRGGRLFKASTFLTFDADAGGTIPVTPLYLYLARSILEWNVPACQTLLARLRIDMMTLDGDNDGYLTPQEVEAFVRGMVPSLKLLEGLTEDFLPLYCTIATRKFLFFGDPQCKKRKGKLSIKELLLSPVLTEMLELQEPIEDEEEAEAVLQGNWFAHLPARQNYELFRALDVDESGGLSQEELQEFSANITPIFIQRVFEVHVHQQGTRSSSSGITKNADTEAAPQSSGAPEMGFLPFLDLMLALEHKDQPQALAYLFRCLDLQDRGYITAADIDTLFRPVHRRWLDEGLYELRIADVKDEIFDMVKPQDGMRITLKDLVNCKQGGTVCSMLFDVGAFWAHDNRENLPAYQS